MVFGGFLSKIEKNANKNGYDFKPMYSLVTEDIKNADIIIGYRADDSYFSFAQDFVNNTIFQIYGTNKAFYDPIGCPLCPE